MQNPNCRRNEEKTAIGYDNEIEQRLRRVQVPRLVLLDRICRLNRFLVYYLADRPFPAASYVSSSSADSTTGKTTAKVSDKNIRLPGTALPRHYYVRLFHVLEKCNFTIPGPVFIYLVKAKRRRTESCCTARTSVVEPKSVSVQ